MARLLPDELRRLEWLQYVLSQPDRAYDTGARTKPSGLPGGKAVLPADRDQDLTAPHPYYTEKQRTLKDALPTPKGYDFIPQTAWLMGDEIHPGHALNFRDMSVPPTVPYWLRWPVNLVPTKG